MPGSSGSYLYSPMFFGSQIVGAGDLLWKVHLVNERTAMRPSADGDCGAFFCM